MRVTTYYATSRTEIDGLIAYAKAKGKRLREIEDWALGWIKDAELRTYCIDRARRALVD
jgi:hypothetical protein